MEFVKKTYKPKEDKVKKLTTYITQLKIVKGIKCDLFTKTTQIIAIMIFFTGCSAEWHLKKAIQKNPAMAQTSIHTIDTLFVRDSVTITDTFTTEKVDTITIEKDGVKTIVYRNHDVIRVHTVVKADTIRYTKTIQLPPRVEYKERIKVPQVVGVGLGLILLGLLLFLLARRWKIKITITQPNPHKVGKPHHGVPHKEVEHGHVSAKTN